jgi:integrase
MIGLPQRLEEYLTIRRAMGYKMERHAKLLGQFLDYLTQQHATTVTLDHALAWATLPSSARPRWWALRLSVVRGFALHLQAIDLAHQVPPRGLISYGHRSITPYLYADHEVAALIGAAGQLSGALRAATYQTLIRLLTVTGMRVGEAIGLDREDFDSPLGVLTIHGSKGAKFGKTRQLPLHPTATAGLGDYLRLRDQLRPTLATSALLVSSRGNRLRYNHVWETFHALVGQAGLRPRSPGCTPRIHDLRHSFAVTTLLECYRAGADVAAMLPRLSTYLGHTDPKHTYWYLSAAPELLALAADRLDAHQKDLQ